MENIIRKAIEGGYASDRPEYARQHLITGFEGDFRFMILDPLFWQALGKACGWESNFEDDRCISFTDGSGKKALFSYMEMDWQFYALRFHEINLTQGWDKVVKYLEDLIK